MFEILIKLMVGSKACVGSPQVCVRGFYTQVKSEIYLARPCDSCLRSGLRS